MTQTISPSDLEELRKFVRMGQVAQAAIDRIGASVESGISLCDRMSLDRALSPAKREQARRELHRHLPYPAQLFPSWAVRRLGVKPPEIWHMNPMAPSVINHKGRLLMSVRCINYSPGKEENYFHNLTRRPMGSDMRPASRTLMMELDPATLEDRDLCELLMPEEMPPAHANAGSYGFEDVRMFEWGGDLWGIAAFGEQAPDGLSEQWLVRIDLDKQEFCDVRRIEIGGWPRRSEKNWMPLIGLKEPKFIYWCDPTKIVTAGGVIVSHKIPESLAAEHFHGGSQAVPFDGGWLAAVHWRQVLGEPEWIEFEYRNRLIWFDKDFRLSKAAPAMMFPIDEAALSFWKRFQIAHGLAWHPDGERLVLTYSLYERMPWVATIRAEDIRARLS